jgi:plasmid maintenance system killer protein
VNIEFKTEKIRRVCNDSKIATKELGADNAGKLRRRLDDLRAASSLEVMRNLAGRCHELKGDRKGELTLDLKHPIRLVFEPWGPDIKNKEDGGLDWSSVKVVRIIGVEDTHD